MMAFGAGALLFAVATELYGHALHQVDVGTMGLDAFFTIIFGALIGGAFYLTANQALDNYLCSGDEDEEPAGPSTTDTEKGSAKASETSSIAADMRSKVDATAQGEEKSTPRSGKNLWAAAKTRTKELTRRPSLAAVIKEAKQRGKELRGREKAIMSMGLDDKDAQHSKSVAYALFLGLLIDGVPEGVLMGFLCAEGHFTPALIISLFVANFPEAFSSSSLLKKARIGNGQILGMWFGLCLLVGSLAGVACGTLLHFYPHGKYPWHMQMTIALVEGITGGAMISCIASVMLPEAFSGAGKTGPFYSQSGYLCLTGFLMSASMKALFG